LLLILLALVQPTDVCAQPTDAAVPARARVRVRLVGPLSRDATLRDRIQSWFDPGTYEVTLQGATYLDPNQVLAPESGLLVEAWITERSSGSLRLYFASVDAKTRKTRYLLRDIALERGLDEVAAEELAQTVHLSASALVEGELMTAREQVEESLREAPAPPPRTAESPPVIAPPRAPAKDAFSPELHAALGYSAALLADEGFAHGPRLRGGVREANLGGFLRLSAVIPHRVTRTELDLDLFGGGVLLAATYGVALSPKVRCDGFLGPALELVRYRAVAHVDSGFAPAAAATELRPQIALGAMVSLGSSPRVVLVPELAVSLTDTRYEAARGATRETVARASRITPSLGLELEL
jgi:hypothetical protein